MHFLKSLFVSAIALSVFISCQSSSRFSDRSVNQSDSSGGLSDFDPDQSLFALGVLISAAADAASEDDLKSFGLFHIKSTYWDEAFPMRAAIREEVKKWPPSIKQELLKLLKEAPSYWSIYSALFLESLGAPPLFQSKEVGVSTKFNPTFQNIFESRKKWSKIAAEIYRSQDLALLWSKHKKYWEAQQLTQKKEDALKKAVVDYMRLRPSTIDQLPDYKVIVNPLMAPGNGGNTFPDADKVILAVGPTDPVGIEVVSAHEFMHQPVNLLVLDSTQSWANGPPFKTAELAQAFNTSECAMKSVKRNWGYVQWWNFSTEALIRAASNRIVRAANQEEANFQFEEDFAELLVDFENNPEESFEDFLVRSLSVLQEKYCHSPRPN